MENLQFKDDQPENVSSSSVDDKFKLSVSQSAKIKKMLASSPLEGIESKQSAKILTPAQKKKLNRSEKQVTSGAGWFDLPLGEVTEEVKTDFKILKLRNYLGEKRRYKEESIPKAIPKYFQVGKVVEDASDFYSSRLTNHERKSNFAEEILANSELRKKTKQKVLDLHQRKRTVHKIQKQRKKKNVTKLAKKALAESQKKKKTEN